MKTVFPNHNACAHVWAAQSQPEGRSGPLWFDGKTIYSYGRHYAIATFTRPDVVLFNSIGSTPTTEGKHKNAVRRALDGHAARVFMAPPNTWGRPAEVLAHLVQRHADALECAARSRKYTESNLERASEYAADAQLFARLFDLPPPVLLEYDRDAIMARVAQQAKANAAERAAAKAQQAIAAADRRTKYEVALKAWKFQGGPPVQWIAPHDAPTALRLSADGASVETSRGASVPVAAARLLWELIASTKAQGIGRNDIRLPVGHFELRKIRADGTAIVWCHELQYAETYALAKAQGWAE